MRVRFAAGLAVGLIAGIAVGIAVTVIVFLAWFNTLTQALVGIGTLAISLVALYQSRLGVQERYKRDLAQRVYTPLRAEVVKWLDPEHQPFHVWNELREKEFYWTKNVPKDITELLDKAGQVYERLLDARLIVNTLTYDETARLGDGLRKTMGLPIPEGKNPPTMHVLARNQDVGTIYPTNFWVSRKGLRDYIQTLVNKKFPNMEWTAVFLLDGKPQGGLPEVEDFMGKVMTFYQGNPQARGLRKGSDELRALGSKLLLRIDEEVG